MHRGALCQPVQVRDKERMSGDCTSPHCVVWQRCVSFPWAQHELWELGGTENGLRPRPIRAQETGGEWVPGLKERKCIPGEVSMPKAMKKVTSSIPRLQVLNRQ